MIRLRASLRAGVCLVVALGGCQCSSDDRDSKRPPAEPHAASVASPLTAPAAAAPEARVDAAPPTAPTSNAQPVLSNGALVALLFDPSIMTETPEETETRFSGVGPLEKISVAPGYLTLEAKRAAHRLAIDYTRGPNGWAFSSVQVALYPASPSDLKSLYDLTDKALHERLGRPLWSRRVEGSSLKSKAYRVGKTLELSIAEDSDKAHESLVSLGLGEPQGEAE